ncbi:MAG TPA: hypothetical protein VK832_04065 [Burkholderiaceae bacterium]|jgi:hypothetical protein|nr:hypothetical protein [Burkholderiaceae bacterium]
MVLNNLSGAGNYYSHHYSPSGLGKSSAANANPVSGGSASPTATASPLTANPVTLSNAAQALQGQNSDAAGSSDFAQEQQLLTTLTDKSLAALGIVSTADEASTQISFSSLSYDVSSSTTASINQQGQQSSVQASNTQEATLIGQGEITTADGTQYAFQVELQVDQGVQATATSDSGNTNAASNTNANTNTGANATGTSTNTSASTNAPDSTASSQQPSNLLAQLVNALEQLGGSSGTSGTNSSNNFLTGNNDTSASNSGAGQSAQSTSSSGINWSAIQKQTASLFDLLDSLATPSQTQTPVSTAS